MVTVAVIGAGAVAQSRYIPALKANDSATVTWVVDVNEDRASAVADEIESARFATDHTEILDSVDAAVISTPPRFHEPIARDCIRNEVHILTEKPVALSSQDATSVTSLAAKEGLHYAICRQYRESPSCQLLKFLVEQGTVGELQHVNARFGDETNWAFASDYRLTATLAGGGVLADKGQHLLDVLVWILDSDIDVGHYADDSYGGLEANAELDIRVSGTDATGTLEITASRTISNSIEIVGTAGRIHAEPDGMAVELSMNEMDEKARITTRQTNPPRTADERMNRQVDRFLDALTDNGSSTGDEQTTDVESLTDGEVTNADELRTDVEPATGSAVSYVPASTDVPILEIIESCYENRSQLSHSWEQVGIPHGGST